ncbi:MAG TPA: hypothetical protein VMP11_20840 [Verrucomicrobiae bacterium]|nr:hypothetical protein [Verrucomicrobiae bacterium]
MVWAKSVGDVQTFLGSVDPEETNATVKSHLNKFGQTSEEERSKRLIDESKIMAGLQILNQFPLADDEVLMQVNFQVQASNGAIQQGDAMMVLKKVDGEWKYLNEYLSPAFRRMPSN